MEERGKDGFLPFLNTRVRFCNGIPEIRWYRKPSSKNIMLHSRSAHPTYMKVNVYRMDRCADMSHSVHTMKCTHTWLEYPFTKDEK
ncbi:hypothetical protein Y032_0024g1031 [Ancylostoma ceylanicum]|uniref:Uncharacterized protein n=1 Tax=Ancylostoma ceylanicum TaxID=53326 RepID=A0A016UXY5_9BILA|nr:hypothetical protein Y032_0024g1031 [Ancylostoma ceylanicum]